MISIFFKVPKAGDKLFSIFKIKKMLPVAHQNFRTVVCWTTIQPEKYTPRNLVRHVLKFDKITLTVELGYATCTLVGYEFKQNHSIQSIDGRYLYSIDYTMKLSVCQPISSV